MLKIKKVAAALMLDGDARARRHWRRRRRRHRLLIGRQADGRTTTLRIAPIVGPARRGVFVSLKLP